MKTTEKIVNVPLDLNVVAEKVYEIRLENDPEKLATILLFVGDMLEAKDYQYVLKRVEDLYYGFVEL